MSLSRPPIATFYSQLCLAKDRARSRGLLQFEKAKILGNFEVIKRDSVWRLLHLKILILFLPPAAL